MRKSTVLPTQSSTSPQGSRGPLFARTYRINSPSTKQPELRASKTLDKDKVFEMGEKYSISKRISCFAFCVLDANHPILLASEYMELKYI